MKSFLAMVRLTLRELWARRITVGLFLVSTLVWVLLSFTLNLDIVEGSLAGVRILGQDAGVPTHTTVQPDGDRVKEALSLDTFVASIQSVIAGIAYWAATLLGIFAAAPLLPGLLARGQADLVFSKPTPRLVIFGGHLLGVTICVLVLSLYLFSMIGVVLAIKTGVIIGRLYWAVLVVVCMFMVMYAVVSLMAITTDSPALALIVAYGLILTSLAFVFRDQLELQINRPWRGIYVGFYNVLPNFAEVTRIVAGFAGTEPVRSWQPLVSSVAFGVTVYALAAWRLLRRDF